MTGKSASFPQLRWLAVLLFSLLWTTTSNSAASAEHGDFGHSAFAAKTPLALPAPRPTFGSSLPDVSKSVVKNGSLPDNFITKADAKALGWNPKTGNLDAVAPGKSIGGDVFGNKEGLLPSAPGRTWFEADLNYTGGYRGGERLLYSNDGKLFYSGDHYKTFQQIGN
jgi:ribonuclease